MNLDEVLERVQGLAPDAKAALLAKAAQDRPKFVPSPGPQTDAWFSKADVLLYGGQPGGGKDLALDTEILTAGRGWQTMGSLRVGDVVFASDGRRTTVVAKSEVFTTNQCYLVSFNTGEQFVAGEGHQWLTLTNADRQANLQRNEEWRERRKAKRPSRAIASPKRPRQSEAAKVANAARQHDYLPPLAPSARTTQEIAASLYHGGKANHSVAVAGALDTAWASLPIDPYLLGLWLGDGRTSGGEIGMMADDLDQVLEHVPDRLVSRLPQKGRHQPFDMVRFECLQTRLRTLGLLGNKRIPDAYQMASPGQRLALLQGLMDTDGTATKSGSCEIALSCPDLIGDVLFLISSLGIKARVQKPKKTVGKDSHRIKFATSHPVFRLRRKAERQNRKPNEAYVGRRYIVGVEPMASVATQCIQVDSPDHSYLIGRTLIPTHNSGLLCGLALMCHERTLLMRRHGVDLEGGGGLIEDLLRLNGTRDGFSGKYPATLRTEDGRTVTFAAAANAGDEQKLQGRPRDLLGLDEATQFSETQVRFLMGWVRTTTEGQRTRTIFATNPPATSEGEWIVGMFRPWLDPTHPNPAKHGELRWFIMTPDGDLEVDGPETVQRDGREFAPMSRTFIPSSMYDNPFIDAKVYQRQLDQLLPEQQHIATGDFMAARKDDEWQVIPTKWIEEAEARWTAEPPEHAPMCAMGVDPAQGGDDETVIACRYDGWFAPLICIPGKDTPTGNEVAGAVIAHRRNNAQVIVDMGGGYGGATKMRLADNNIEVKGHKGAAGTSRRTVDQQYTFTNKRSEIIWRMREALDPAQDGGSQIALPPDRQLRADLTAPRFKVTSTGIKVESKEDVVKRLGRSPDRGDAVCMAWAGGPTLLTHGNQWRAALKSNRAPTVMRGRRK